MKSDEDIWDQIGTLTLDRARQGRIDLAPLPSQEGNTGPLREVLRHFLLASPEVQSRYSLRLENGQTFSEPDISELLSRPDCPIR